MTYSYIDFESCCNIQSCPSLQEEDSLTSTMLRKRTKALHPNNLGFDIQGHDIVVKLTKAKHQLNMCQINLTCKLWIISSHWNHQHIEVISWQQRALYLLACILVQNDAFIYIEIHNEYTYFPEQGYRLDRFGISGQYETKAVIVKHAYQIT